MNHKPTVKLLLCTALVLFAVSVTGCKKKVEDASSAQPGAAKTSSTQPASSSTQPATQPR